jgi:serine/threonine-protein kinase
LESNIRLYGKEDRAFLYNLFYLQIAQRKFEAADVTIKKMELLHSGNASINELIAYKNMAKRDYQAAISFYKKSLDTKTTASNLHYISMAYWYSANTELAKKRLKQAISLSPNAYKSLSLFGSIELLNGDVNEALASFKNIANQKPDDTYNNSHLGLCYLLLKNYVEAIGLFDKAIESAPRNAYVRLNKADAYDLMGRAEDARRNYEDLINSIVSESTQHTITNEELSSLSQAYAHTGNYSKALTTLQQLEKVDPQNIETTYAAALVHTLAKNNASAILNVQTTLGNGMNKIWFSLSWFDSLCNDVKFSEIMKKYGEPNRCAPIL